MNIILPKYIENKNARISAKAMELIWNELSKLNGKEMAQIGVQLIANKNDKLIEVLTPAGAKTIDEAIKMYMPEIISITLGSFTLGAIIGANWNNIVKSFKK